MKLTNNSYVASIPIGQFSEKGTWKIQSISIIDKAGNSNYIYNSEFTNYNSQDLKAGNFTVIGTTPDVDTPTLGLITLNKKTLLLVRK